MNDDDLVWKDNPKAWHQQIARTIATRLAHLRPDHAEQIRWQAEQFVARLVEKEKIPIILRSTFTDERPARRLAERTTAHVVELPAAVGAVDGADDYVALFSVILGQLETFLMSDEGP